MLKNKQYYMKVLIDSFCRLVINMKYGLNFKYILWL